MYMEATVAETIDGFGDGGRASESTASAVVVNVTALDSEPDDAVDKSALKTLDLSVMNSSNLVTPNTRV